MIHSVQMVHFDSVSVSLGDVVTQGQKLGVMGTTGNSTGEHVHMTIVPQEWGNPTERWGIGNVLAMGGTREQIMAFTGNMEYPLLKRGSTNVPYMISYGGGWWGVEASYEGHYALDFIPSGAQTPFPDVVWSYPTNGRVVAINKTNRAVGLWVIIEVDFSGSIDPDPDPTPKRKSMPLWMMVKYT